MAKAEVAIVTMEMHYTHSIDFEDVREMLHSALTERRLAGAFDTDETTLLGIGRIDVDWKEDV